MRCPKCGGRLAGRGFAVREIIVLVAVIILGVALVMIALRHLRETYRRMVCGTNLSQIGMAMLIYVNDYGDKLPHAGGRDTVWGGRVIWDAPDHFQAYSLSADGSGGMATISSSFYLLLKYTKVTPKLFICPGDSGATRFKLSDYPMAKGKEIKDFWDFGPIPQKHCSYTYHMPYGLYPLTKSSEPAMAVTADRNPWIRSPATETKDFSLFKPDVPPWNGTTDQAKYGNAPTHKDNGQNVLFMDSHVDFEKRAYCGIDDDNIYTSWNGEDRIGGTPPALGSQPVSRQLVGLDNRVSSGIFLIQAAGD